MIFLLRRYVEAGMDEVVTKPFLVRELVPRMVALVQKCLR
jgi:DNA-binding response OmpR family regulator